MIPSAFSKRLIVGFSFAREFSSQRGPKRITMKLLERLAANDPELTKLFVPRSVEMHELATALALNTTVTFLGLSDRGLVAADVNKLAGMLERNKTLTTLHLTNNNLGDNGARRLAAALGRNRTLKVLKLTMNVVGADGCRHLAAALERNSTLRELDLQGNSIEDNGACHLAAALERNSTLTVLLLGGNIGAAGIAAFRAALETNWTLERLYGVRAVYDMLERNCGNRRICVARAQKVMLHLSLLLRLMFLPSAFALLWFCSG
jgi:Ran GTPase-activating protein (RanGAP) involved in mRNA processing and transport